MARGVDSVVDSRIFVATTVESCHNIVCFGSAASGWHFFYIFFLEKCCTLKVLCIFVKQTNKQSYE